MVKGQRRRLTGTKKVNIVKQRRYVCPDLAICHDGKGRNRLRLVFLLQVSCVL